MIPVSDTTTFLDFHSRRELPYLLYSFLPILMPEEERSKKLRLRNGEDVLYRL